MKEEIYKTEMNVKCQHVATIIDGFLKEGESKKKHRHR